MKEGAKFCPECGNSLSGVEKSVGKEKTEITINRKVIASLGMAFGLLIMVIAAFQPWARGIWGGSANMLDIAFGESRLASPVSLLVFSAILLLLGGLGQVKSTVGGVPLLTRGEKAPTKLRYLAPLGLLLCIVGFVWFFSEVESASTEYVSAWDLIGSGVWIFGLGFLIWIGGYGELIRG